MYKQVLVVWVMAVALMLSACGTGEVAQQAVNDESNQVSGERTETVEEAADEDATENQDDKANAEKAETDTADEQVEEKNTHLNELSVHYMNVGQADATLFQYENDQQSYTILYDTGDWRRNDTVQYLASQNISSIDLIVISHPDADHIGQLAEIVNTYDVGEVWMSGNTASSKTFQGALEAVLNSDADYEEPRSGDTFSIGPMDITVLYPNSISGKANEESLSLLMSYGDIDFIFTGDADQAAEKVMMQSGIDLDAEILQLGHHGSRTSSAPAFIKAVQPEVAIYSAGADSQYGHPHAEVIETIQNAGIDLYGTDVNGTIVVKTDGKTYDILTKKDGTISPKTTGRAESDSQTAREAESSESSNQEQSVSSSADCVDINSASIERVQEIKHIGPARAEDLVKLRPFNSIDDLTKINGIGPSRIVDIKQEGKVCAQ
ncbi:MBL fold metallo-hydrolase [Lentibacillus sp. JNUCC-1]|uniref:MBL fold metallo-hydrolase n=1 Tax=Lentibacillus sp. JNUCC-1 TaxID=2654513 RepID=UPI0012E96B8F|nr:MBL fold metallo-hydrolase [Lentibacillus sp. JNUCC-1]